MLCERAERIKVRIERLIWLDEIVEKLEKSIELFKMRLGRSWRAR